MAGRIRFMESGTLIRLLSFFSLLSENQRKKSSPLVITFFHLFFPKQTMGKRVQGAALRAKKRAKVNLDEVQEKQAEQVASAGVSTKRNADLFVLDVTGGTVPHSEQQPKKKHKKETGLSDKDQQAIAKLLEKHDSKELKDLASKGSAIVNTKNRVRTKGLRSQTKANYDLWDAADDDGVAAKRVTPANTGMRDRLAGVRPDQHALVKARRAQKPKKAGLAVDVAKGGQSYRPDPVSHKQLIEKAVGFEQRRQEAVNYMEAPISKGLSEETRALLLGDSDSEEDMDVEEDNEQDDGPVGEMPKRANKLTRAQRNKKQRLRQEQAVLDKRKKNKRLMNEVGEIPRYNKEMKHHRRTKQGERELVETTKRNLKPLGKDVDHKLSQKDPVGAPTLAVALSSELKSNSLRTIRPKGSLVEDRISSLRDRKLAPTRAVLDGNAKKYYGRRRKLATRGTKNNEAFGDDFAVMG